jgi:DNA-binding response OmpR family regulator
LNRQPTVLLIEDDENTRFALTCTFARAGYLVLTAPTGHDAVGIIQSEKAPLDVVLLDVGLPDVSGVDLCARLREMRPDLPVIVCSGKATQGEATRLRELGVLQYHRKPIQPNKLLSAIASGFGRDSPDYKLAQKIVRKLSPEDRRRLVRWMDEGME